MITPTQRMHKKEEKLKIIKVLSLGSISSTEFFFIFELIYNKLKIF